jgi:hypothetical protein
VTSWSQQGCKASIKITVFLVSTTSKSSTTCLQKLSYLLMHPPGVNLLVITPGDPNLGSRRSIEHMQQDPQRLLRQHSEQAAAGDGAKPVIPTLFRALPVAKLPCMSLLALRSNSGGVLASLEAAVFDAAVVDIEFVRRAAACGQVRGLKSFLCVHLDVLQLIVPVAKCSA